MVIEPTCSQEATARALGQAEDRRRRNLAIFVGSAERAHYDAEHARRQYDAVDPEVRLVVHTVERACVGQDHRRPAGRKTTCAASRPAARCRLPVRKSSGSSWSAPMSKAVFHAATTTISEGKQLPRAMISEAVINGHADTRVAELKIMWQGGAVIALAMPMNKTGGRLTDITSEDILNLVRRRSSRPGQTRPGWTLRYIR